MKKLSGIDLGFIIAFVVVGLLGGGVWWYQSSELQTVQDDDTAAKSDFDEYSTKSDIVVTKSNGKILQGNLDLIRSQLNPLIESKLLRKENKLSSVQKEDPVAWKHDLDDEVHRLTSMAKLHGVTIQPNFYFGFSRYLNQSPNDEQTAVLSKQLIGVEQITTILVNAPVKGIQAIRRTYEEDPHTGPGTVTSFGMTTEPDRLGGYASIAPANIYTSYPFEIEFDAAPENLRTVIDNLLQSPYVFVIRTLTVENTTPNSPMLNDLEKLAGPPPAPVTDSTPGEVAATTSTKGPQFLFGASTLHIKTRIDMIEWTGGTLPATSGGAPGGSAANTPAPGGA